MNQDVFQHNIDKLNNKRDLQAQLNTARQNVLDARAKWKQDATDTNRFALQTALSIETQLDKLLWQFD